MTSAGGTDNWSLDECARWAREHDFDCVRLNDSGALDSDHILSVGPDAVLSTLRQHDLYLAALTAHYNLLDDDREQAPRRPNQAAQGHCVGSRPRLPRHRHQQRRTRAQRPVLRHVLLRTRQPQRPFRRISRSLPSHVRTRGASG